MSGKSTFKRKQRSPFGLVDEVLGDVAKERESVKEEPEAKEAQEEPVDLKVNSVAINKEPEIIEARVVPTENNLELTIKSSQLDSKIELYSKLSKLESGFTKMNNQILMGIMSKGMSRAEILTLLAIVRMTLGWQKKEASLSYGVLSDLTKIESRSSISKAVKLLVEKGFIYRKSGNVNSANRLGLTDKYYTPHFVTEEKDTVSADSKQVSNPRKELENFDEILDRIKAPGKKGKEVKALKGLLKVYSSEDIIAAYNYVYDNGSLTGEKVKLHLTYLSVSIDEVLEKIVSDKYKSKSTEQKAKAVSDYKEQQLLKKKEMIYKNAKIQELKAIIRDRLKEYFSEKELSSQMIKKKAIFLAENPLHKSMPRPILDNLVKAMLAYENKLITLEEKNMIDN